MGRLRRIYGPHRHSGLAVVNPPWRGVHLPVTITQVIGGRRWSLALVRVGEIRRDEA